MVNTSPGITLFTEQDASVLRIEQLYVPGTAPSRNTAGLPIGNIIPVVGTLVIDVVNNNTLYAVDAVDPNTHATTLGPARMPVDNTNPDDALVSIISYGNDIFRLYYDLRASPTIVWPDRRLVVFGVEIVSYQLVTNPGTPQQVILSQNYDSTGTYTGPLVPMAAVTNATGTALEGAQYCAPCRVTAALTDNQEVFVQFFNSQGALEATASMFTKQSIIVNEAGYLTPTIAGVSIISTQSRGNNEIFIFQNQDVDSLGIQVQLTYTDGHSRIVPVDNSQCYIYGLADFVSSYPGLQQEILVKYFLGSDESASSALSSQGQSFVTAEVSLVVVANELATGVKISAIPRWNNSTSKYDLFFYLYTDARTNVTNVTGLVSINPSTPYNGSLYGVAQNLILDLDMSQVFPSAYSVSTLYQQTLIITLQPIAALTRYILQDASNAPLAYGADSTNNRRPIVNFSTSLNQYSISTIFANTAAFIQSFYTDANPPYDVATETQPVAPTHFQLRDPASGFAITSAPIPLASFNSPFSITGTGLQNRYTGTGATVIVEFLAQINSNTTLILYGSAVDVYVIA